MDANPELIKLGAQLAGYVTKNSVTTISDRIKAAKTKGNKDEIINNLEQIISEIISDKTKLIQISQAFEEQLIMQTISEKDIEYITVSIVPLLEEVLEKSEGEDVAKFREGMDILKPILSKETFKILQLLGFNFKQAIGEPLTHLVRSSIVSNAPTSTEKSTDYNMLVQEREIEYLKVIQNEEAYNRLQKMKE